MMKIVFANLIIIALILPTFSAGRYLLQSELRTNYGPNSTLPPRLTTYVYSNFGAAIKVFSFKGGDTLSGLDNSIIYGYDSIQRRISMVQLNSGVDTVAVNYYGYNAGGDMNVIKTMVNKSGNWQIDSLKYDSNHKLLERWHFATITDFHRYSYNASGQEAADTLFEQSATVFMPTQSNIFDYSVTNVISQKHYFVAGGSWYCDRDSVATYSNNRLLSNAVYDPSGVTPVLMDSLFFSYDTLGNKTEVSHFDKTGARTYTIDYQWFANPYASVLARAQAEKKNLEIAYSKRYVSVHHSEYPAGYLAIFTLDGKLVKKETVMAGSNYSMALPGISQGKYIAVYNSSGMRQSLAFNVTN